MKIYLTQKKWTSLDNCSLVNRKDGEKMFGEGDIFQGLINLFLYAAVLLTIIWLFFKFIETKTGKIMEKHSSAFITTVIRWHERLPYNAKKAVGWLSLVFYCLCIISLFIWMES